MGLLGSVMSLCEDVSRAEGLSPWAGEGGYGRAPGFEREDQVNAMNTSGLCDIFSESESIWIRINYVCMFVCLGQAQEFCS